MTFSSPYKYFISSLGFVERSLERLNQAGSVDSKGVRSLRSGRWTREWKNPDMPPKHQAVPGTSLMRVIFML